MGNQSDVKGLRESVVELSSRSEKMERAASEKPTPPPFSAAVYPNNRSYASASDSERDRSDLIFRFRGGRPLRKGQIHSGSSTQSLIVSQLMSNPNCTQMYHNVRHSGIWMHIVSLPPDGPNMIQMMTPSLNA